MPNPTSTGLPQNRGARNSFSTIPDRPASTTPVPPVPPPPVKEQRASQAEPSEPLNRFQLQEYLTEDPIFNAFAAALILGRTESRLEKWRQRGQGPDYLRYPDRHIGYELSALVAFKAAIRVRPDRQPKAGRRA